MAATHCLSDVGGCQADASLSVPDGPWVGGQLQNRTDSKGGQLETQHNLDTYQRQWPLDLHFNTGIAGSVSTRPLSQTLTAVIMVLVLAVEFPADA
jgi:hypothetical protein